MDLDLPIPSALLLWSNDVWMDFLFFFLMEMYGWTLLMQNYGCLTECTNKELLEHNITVELFRIGYMFVCHLF